MDRLKLLLCGLLAGALAQAAMAQDLESKFAIELEQY